jgi:di/tricarboxylate transporter
MKKALLLLLLVSAAWCLFEARARLALAHQENGAILFIARNTAAALPNGTELVQQLNHAMKSHSEIQKRSISTAVVLGFAAGAQLITAGFIILSNRKRNNDPNKLKNPPSQPGQIT